ncbi:hypothetical protein [Candidatus Formimonas warabiya]|uniref:Uncharacterized protein n=1 Tax=Formimonas warabiya TaxID=1761012 RepID=A0A3G1KT00_FORW1|nr:hypothetical protein [Candidatus Formimonas warabiya]ATW25581.1 hypothetical protein DCMF_13170 [Candidatus Formimonas warabiya]
MKKAKMILSTILIGGLISSFGGAAFAATAPQNCSTPGTASYGTGGNTGNWQNSREVTPQNNAGQFDGKDKRQTDGKEYQDNKTKNTVDKKKTSYYDEKKSPSFSCDKGKLNQSQNPFDIFVSKGILSQKQVNQINEFVKQHKISTPVKVEKNLLNDLVKARIITQDQANKIQKILADTNANNDQNRKPVLGKNCK